jgi:2-phospho-L-lactate guanylyltransferase
VSVTAIVPVKAWQLAKSRLTVSCEHRIELARAFALDALDVLRGTPSIASIVLVTAEPELLSPPPGRRGITVLEEAPQTSSDPLNDAVRLGRGWAEVHRAADGLLVVPSDLPAMTSQALQSAVDQLVGFDRAFVPDLVGEGTTLLFARRPGTMRPQYGRRSAFLHRADHYAAVTAVDPAVRRDVDTLRDLAEARRLGVGAHTGSALGPLPRTGHRRPAFV